MRNMNRPFVVGGTVLALGLGGLGVSRLAGAEADLTADAAAAQLDLTITQGVDCVELVKEHGQPMYDGQGPSTIESGGTTYVRFRVGAAEAGTRKLYQDGPNVPLQNRTTEGMQASICQDPLEAGIFVAGMHDERLKIGDKTPGQVNAAWIPEELRTMDGVNDWAAKAMTDNVKTHNEAQEVMARAAAMFGKLHPNGVTKDTTLANAHLPNAEGVKEGSLPEVAWNHEQYTGYFISAKYVLKTGKCALNVGFNVGKDKVDGGDQRFAILPCKEEAKATNPSPSSTSTPSESTSPSTSACNNASKPQDPEHTYAPVMRNGCVVRWVIQGSSLNSGPQNQGIQTDRGDQSGAQQQEGVVDTPPASQPEVPVAPAAPPAPTNGGYNGGSTTQPGQTGTPNPGPSQPPVQGDPGGF